MNKQFQSGSGYDFWKVGKIRYINNGFYLVKSRFSKRVKVNLSKIEIDKIKAKQKQVFDKDCTDTFNSLRKIFFQKMLSSSSLFQLVEEEQTAYNNLLNPDSGEILPKSDLCKINFGSLRFKKSKVVAIRNAAALDEKSIDYNKYHPKKRKLLLMPVEDIQIEAKAYSLYFEWIDSINSILQLAVKQINNSSRNRYSKNILVHSNLKRLQAYFNNNLSKIFIEIIPELNKIEGVNLNVDFASVLQLNYIENLLSVSIEELEHYEMLYTELEGHKLVARYYKDLYKVLEFCNVQTRNFKTNIGYDRSRIDNTKIIVLLQNQLNYLDEMYHPDMDSKLWYGQKFHKFEIEYLSTLSDLGFQINNSSTTLHGALISEIETSSTDFRLEKFEQYKMYYPAFLLNWISDSTCDSKCEVSFINHTIEYIDNCYLNFSPTKNVVIHHASASKSFCFTLTYYNTFVIPLFVNIKQFLEGRLDSISYKDKRTHSTIKSTDFTAIQPPSAYLIKFNNNAMLKPEDNLKLYREKVGLFYDILITKTKKFKSCIDPTIDKEFFINQILNPAVPVIKFQWGLQDLRYIVSHLRAHEFNQGIRITNDFALAASLIFLNRNGKKINHKKLGANSHNPHPDKINILSRALNPLY